MIRAILIALVLVVQTFGSAYATGLGNRPILLDAFGNPLCITSGEHGGAGDDNRHGAQKDCCTLACANVAAVSAPPPALAETGVPAARLLAVLDGRAFGPVAAPAVLSQGNPRGPPSA